MIRTAQPDIIVTSADGEYLMVVEVKLNDVSKRAYDQLRSQMASVDCAVGLLVSGDRIVLMRDSLEKYNGDSISVIGEAKLPDSLLNPVDGQWKEPIEFELQVQRWLENLKLTASVKNLPNDLQQLFGESIINLLRIGEVRSAGPRWSKVAT
jgi:hypothetical protein